jgi:hypothetical protein
MSLRRTRRRVTLLVTVSGSQGLLAFLEVQELKVQ